MKTGRWEIDFEIVVDGKQVQFQDLNDSTQEQVLFLIRNGFTNGEIIEED